MLKQQQQKWFLRPLFFKSHLYESSKLQINFPDKTTIQNKFQFSEETISIKEAITKYGSSLNNQTTKTFTINGWIDSHIKKIGNNLYFATLRDTDGTKIQLVDKHEPSLLKSCNTLESCVQIKGHLAVKKQPRKIMQKSESNQQQEYEVVLNKLITLNRASIKPSQLINRQVDGNVLKTNYPPEYRYLQLRIPQEQSLLRKRFQVSHFMRQWLYENDFIEIQTPILFKPTPEGAREFVVPTRTIDQSSKRPLFYSLIQSPQQYKQLLMASGISRYFQFAKCFRDEDLRKDRQPEFTQLDIELSFAKGTKVRSLIQELIIKVWAKNQDSKTLYTWDSSKFVDSKDTLKLNSMTYKEAMTLYGVDKPNLIAPNLKIINLTELTGCKSQENINFPIIECLILKGVLNKNSMENDYRDRWRKLLNPKNYNFRPPIGVPITNNTLCRKWFENVPLLSMINKSSNSKEIIEKLDKALNLSPGDIIFISNRQPDHAIFENPTPLGRLRQLLLIKQEMTPLFRETPGPKDDVAIWVVDFPLFSPVEETKIENNQKYPTYVDGQYVSTHHPFTMVKLSGLDHLKNDPLKCIGQHYDLVMNGVELGGGSQRIHDYELQDYIFKHILKINNSHELFGHLLEAFKNGTPPHSGFAIGFDRMCAMLFNRESIRDVIAFPKSITGIDQVVKSPALVDDESLKDYHVAQFIDKIEI